MKPGAFRIGCRHSVMVLHTCPQRLRREFDSRRQRQKIPPRQGRRDWPKNQPGQVNACGSFGAKGSSGADRSQTLRAQRQREPPSFRTRTGFFNFEKLGRHRCNDSCSGRTSEGKKGCSALCRSCSKKTTEFTDRVQLGDGSPMGDDRSTSFASCKRRPARHSRGPWETARACRQILPSQKNSVLRAAISRPLHRDSTTVDANLTARKDDNVRPTAEAVSQGSQGTPCSSNTIEGV